MNLQFALLFHLLSKTQKLEAREIRKCREKLSNVFRIKLNFVKWNNAYAKRRRQWLAVFQPGNVDWKITRRHATSHLSTTAFLRIRGKAEGTHYWWACKIRTNGRELHVAILYCPNPEIPFCFGKYDTIKWTTKRYHRYSFANQCFEAYGTSWMHHISFQM